MWSPAGFQGWASEDIVKILAARNKNGLFIFFVL
jgi:hypothetical protein